MSDTVRIRTTCTALVIALALFCQATFASDAIASPVSELLMSRARAGDPEAQMRLAWLMQHDGEASAAKARLWYKKAAWQGHIQAQNNLALMLFHGKGGRRDTTAAGSWFKKAAAQGNPLAHYNLARMYLQGDGVTLSEAQAVTHLAAAGQAGLVDAQITLGLMLVNGHGVAGNIVEVFAWLVVASQTGNIDANARRREIEAGLTPEQIVAAEKRAATLR